MLLVFAQCEWRSVACHALRLPLVKAKICIYLVFTSDLTERTHLGYLGVYSLNCVHGQSWTKSALVLDGPFARSPPSSVIWYSKCGSNADLPLGGLVLEVRFEG